MEMTGIVCKSCKDFIFSRTRHDFRRCTCESSFVDGGFDYLRFGYSTKLPPIQETRDIGEVTKDELYQDWSKRTDLYGVLRSNEG